ncbi:MAG: hypothetical protein C5B49_08055 [Bdellovibrio sp.]|nr:MAG: hypothetical protein C5B49_08055 [Bdellovibrio sp.]
MSHWGAFHLSTEIWGASQLSLYQRNGYLVVHDIIPREKLWRLCQDISRMAVLKTKHVFGEPGDLDLDTNVAKLDLFDSAHAVELISAAGRLHSFLSITTLPELRSIACFLLGTSDLFLSASSLRYDAPGADHYLIPWHQDYPFIQDSEKSVVVWFPLLDFAPECGGVRILPESNQEGIRKVRQKENWLELAGPIESVPRSSIVPHLGAGDVLFMDTLTIHRSEANRGTSIRWTGQFRIGDYAHPRAVERGWPRGMTMGQHFREYHEEFIVD